MRQTKCKFEMSEETELQTDASATHGLSSTEGAVHERVVMGPPRRGPSVAVSGIGLFLSIQVNDDDDAKILQMFLECAERRRYGKAA